MHIMHVRKVRQEKVDSDRIVTLFAAQQVECVQHGQWKVSLEWPRESFQSRLMMPLKTAKKSSCKR